MWLIHTGPFTAEVRLWFSGTDSGHRRALESVLERWVEEHPVHGAGCREAVAWEVGERVRASCVASADSMERFFAATENLVEQVAAADLGLAEWGLVNLTFPVAAPAWAMAVASLFYLGPAMLVLRRVRMGQDLREGADVLIRRPWVAMVPFVIMLAASGAVAMITSLIHGPAEPASAGVSDRDFEIFRLIGVATLLTPWVVWQGIVLVPVFEEAVFREWLYRKARPAVSVWAAGVINAWFFMLMHVLIDLVSGLSVGPNPGAPGTLALGIPIWFAVGIYFFWLRHRFGSVSLCILVHAFYNGLMFLGFHLASVYGFG